MSPEAKNWSKTHSFGGASKKGAGTRKDILRFLSEEADREGVVVDAGADWIEHETEISVKTIKRVLHEFESLDLLHREKRPHMSFKGQLTDVIVLHIWNIGSKLPWKAIKQLKREKQLSRTRWGAPYEAPEAPVYPVDNSPQRSYPQVDTLSKAPKTVDNSPKNGHHVQNKGGQGVQQWTSCPPEPPKNGQGVQRTNSALIGTRARTSLIDSLSVSQSLNTSRPVDNFQPDRPTDSPKIIHGVNLGTLRGLLEAKTNTDLSGLSDPVLGRIVTIVISRATEQVRSPLAFALHSISSELPELTDLAQTLLENESAANAPKHFCKEHTREYRGDQCPLCLKEKTLILPDQPTEPVDHEKGRLLREEIRARLAQKGR